MKYKTQLKADPVTIKNMLPRNTVINFYLCVFFPSQTAKHRYIEAYINKPSHQAKKFPSINSGIETYM